MDKSTQRLFVAQELVQGLVNLLSLPQQPERSVVQSVLDAAKVKIMAIEAAPMPPVVPLEIPQLVPSA